MSSDHDESPDWDYVPSIKTARDPRPDDLVQVARTMDVLAGLLAEHESREFQERAARLRSLRALAEDLAGRDHRLHRRASYAERARDLLEITNEVVAGRCVRSQSTLAPLPRRG